MTGKWILIDKFRCIGAQILRDLRGNLTVIQLRMDTFESVGGRFFAEFRRAGDQERYPPQKGREFRRSIGIAVHFDSRVLYSGPEFRQLARTRVCRITSSDMARNAVSKRIRLYIDESGDHRPAREGDGFAKRYLCLVGVMFPMDGPLHSALEALKARHFPDHDREDPICLHRRDIIDASPPFASLRDPAKREAFNTELVGLLSEQAFVVIGVVIDKIQHENRKRKEVVLPYDFGFRLMLERYSGRLIHKGHTGDVMAESRGQREDGALRAEYERIYKGGTQYHSAQQFQRALTSKQLKLKGKEANIAGLQLADLLARDVLIDALHRKGVSVPEPSAFSKRVIDVLQLKYNKNTSTGKIDGYGRVIV